MSKLYKLVYHFKDGEKWGENSHDVALSAEQLPFILNELNKKDNMEITQESTGEKRKVSEIKSIELIF